MAKVTPKTPLARGRSFRGRFYDYMRNGSFQAAGWPPKRPGPLSEAQQDTVRLFKAANQAFKLQDAELTATLMKATAGTPYLPRDFAFIMWYGRFRTLTLADGTALRSMATRVNISDLLDNIDWTPGTMLYRGTDLWLPIAPGAAGDVLRYQNPATVPVWGPPTTIAAPSSCIVRRTTDGTVDSTATKICTWQSTARDDYGGWSAGAPTLVTIPSGVTRARLSCMASFATPTGTFGFDMHFLLNGALASSNGVPRTIVEPVSGGFSSTRQSMSSAWINATPGDDWELEITATGSPSWGFLTTTWMAVEVA